MKQRVYVTMSEFQCTLKNQVCFVHVNIKSLKPGFCCSKHMMQVSDH